MVFQNNFETYSKLIQELPNGTRSMEEINISRKIKNVFAFRPRIPTLKSCFENAPLQL